MAHIPVNHHLRTLYRVLAGLAGLYVLAFGILGFIQTRGLDFFAQEGQPWVLGLRANPAFSLLSVAAGAVLVAATIIGRNIDHFLYLVAGSVFMVSGMAMLTLLRTDANFLGFTVTNCIVSFILGCITLAAGLYTKVGTSQQAAAEDEFRHGAATPGTTGGSDRPASTSTSTG